MNPTAENPSAAAPLPLAVVSFIFLAWLLVANVNAAELENHFAGFAAQPSLPAKTGAAVPFKIKDSDRTTGLKYSWDFGDGTAVGPFTSDRTATHAYRKPGHYTVTVTASDGVEHQTRTVAQTIFNPLTPKAPTTASSIILDEARQRVWVVNPDHDTVTAIDAQGMSKLFEKLVGAKPSTLALAPDGTIWVVNHGDATISVLDGRKGSLLHTIKLPHASRPYGIVFSPDDSAAYVTLQGTGRLLKIDPMERVLLQSLEVGPTPRGVAVTADSMRVFVTRFISPRDHGRVTDVRTENFTVARKINLAADTEADSATGTRGVPNYAGSITVSPDGQRAWVPAVKDNTLRGTFRDGRPLTFDSTVRTIVSQINLSNDEEDFRARLDLLNKDSAMAARFSPLGDYVFVAVQGNNCVVVLDAFGGEKIAELDSAGAAPQGLVLSADGTKLFTQNFLSRTVAVHDVAEIASLTETPVKPLKLITTVSREKLPSRVLKGKKIFYNAADPRMSRDGYLSCASCHADGEQDGRVWDFTDRGEGLRNTSTLLGKRGVAEGRLHWTGNFDEIQDFENDIRNAFGGRGFMPDEKFFSGTLDQPLGEHKAGVNAELDALAAFVTSLEKVNPSPHRKADGSLTESGLEGKRIFARLDCATCHAGNDFTDSAAGAVHDIDTIRTHTGKRLGATIAGLDTPTLKGLWETAPYLHDGSAATLLDVITTANPNDMHGKTSGLTSVEQRQLVDYLLQIDESENLEPAGR